MRKNSVKNTRINAEVQRVISETIRSGIKDPRISPMTCVTECIVTPDLKYCTAYISVLGDDDAAADTMAGLKKAVGFIRRELAHIINLRNTPEIRFVLDRSTEYGMHMSKLIDEVNASSQSKKDEVTTDFTEDSDDIES